MKHSAFTLTELLVVTAIVCVLATVLFPILSLAKPSSNLTSSLSSVNQITLAEIIYQGDYNDDFVLSASNFCDAGCPSTNLSICSDNLQAPSPNWPLILEPYVGSLGTYVDPSTADPEGIFSPGSSNYVAQNWNSGPQFGYNYEFLSPLQFQLGGGTCASNSSQNGIGRSGLQAVNPSSTVMFVSAQNFAAQWSLALAYETPDSAFANAPGTDFALLPALDRIVVIGDFGASTSDCFGTTSPFNVSQTVAFGYCGWAGADQLGPLTADVRTMFPYEGASVGWADGHASIETASALAAGTDFSTASAASNPDPIYSFNTGCVVSGLASSGRPAASGATNALNLAAPSGYLWSLDGTLSDIN